MLTFEESTRSAASIPVRCVWGTYLLSDVIFLFPEERPSFEDGLGEMVSLLESSRPGAGLRPELITK